VADLTRPDTLDALPEALDAVVYCVARGRDTGQSYRDVFVTGLANLLDLLEARANQLSRFLFVSSTGVYGPRAGAWVDETSATDPGAEGGRSLLEAESLLHARRPDATAVRFSGIYGPGRTRLIRAAEEGEGTLRRTPQKWLNQIHRDDGVGVLRHLLFLPSTEPVYNATDCEPALRSDVLAWLAERMGSAPPGEAEGLAEDSVSRASKRVSNRRLLASGYVFSYPTYREGYGALLAGEG
jgi:nucleoside-diphosphate-sugar epimerase